MRKEDKVTLNNELEPPNKKILERARGGGFHEVARPVGLETGSGAMTKAV